FAVILADANARLGANADCYSFIAVDFHHLLFAGFYRRTGLLELCTGRVPRVTNRPPCVIMFVITKEATP
ncbi:MAG: hypothetical protein WA231_23855, partial [Methylocella sp.]